MRLKEIEDAEKIYNTVFSREQKNILDSHAIKSILRISKLIVDTQDVKKVKETIEKASALYETHFSLTRRMVDGDQVGSIVSIAEFLNHKSEK
ncbi:MAG: hypothetical protein ACE5K0_04020 [Candidatus Methanofastidiosia archaeon]